MEGRDNPKLKPKMKQKDLPFGDSPIDPKILEEAERLKLIRLGDELEEMTRLRNEENADSNPWHER